MLSKVKVVLLVVLVIVSYWLLFFPPGLDYYQEVRPNKLVIDTGLTNVGFAKFNFTSPKFDCNRFFNGIKDITVLQLAFLYNTFGNDYRCLQRLKRDIRLESLEIALINEPGHRNHRLGPYEFLYNISSPARYQYLLLKRSETLKRKFFGYVARLQKQLVDFPPSVQILINPGLETNVSSKAFSVLAEWAREAFPRGRIVYNPLTPNLSKFSSSTGDLYEQHGPVPLVKAPCIVNPDGTDINFEFVGGRKSLVAIQAEKTGGPKNYINAGAPLQQYIEQYANTCEFVYLWTVEDNFGGAALGFRDPRKRDPRTNGVLKYLANQVKIAHTKGRFVPPSLEYGVLDKTSFDGCQKVVELETTSMAGSVTDGVKSGLILKQSEFPDRGSALLVFGSKAQLIFRGKVVENFTNAGKYIYDNPPQRTLFRGQFKPFSYPFRTVLNVDNGKICYRIPNPRVRND